MFKLLIKKQIDCLYKQNSIIYNIFKINYKFISMTITGRIFRWIKGKYYMRFILPVSNKPSLFLKNNYISVPFGEFTNFIWFTTTNNNFLHNKLFKIKKPSIFNRRGFHILNKILYKKRGKVTSYVTNK